MPDRPLPAVFRTRPLAHRGLHGATRPENSRAAFEAAVAGGYGIELDLQRSADGEAMVFHDDDLDRLTAARGPVAARAASELGRVALTGAAEGIPTLAEVLALVAGRVPLLIEIKDQSRALAPTDGVLEARTAACLVGYDGPVAVMSFNPHAVAAFAAHASGAPVGLTTAAFDGGDWGGASPARLAELVRIADFERLGCTFISHDRRALTMPRVAALKSAGATILAWTIRSPAQEAAARRIADNVTFEGYLPDGD